MGEKGHLIYVGPTIEGLQQNAVFDSISGVAKQVLSKYPEVISLIVPIERAAEVTSALRAKDSMEYKVSEKLKETKSNEAASLMKSSLISPIEKLKEIDEEFWDRGVNLSWFNADATGQVDCSDALKEAIQSCLKHIKVKGRGGTTYRTIVLKVPPGTYKVDETVVADMKLANGHMGDQLNLHIEGMGKSSSVLELGPNANLMFDLPYGSLTCKNVRFIGHDNGCFARVGRNSSESIFRALSQSFIENVDWYYWNQVFEVEHWFDTAFINCGFFSFSGKSPLGINIKLHSKDNTNNLQFYRCHWEGMVDGTFIKLKGGSDSAKQRHYNIGFNGCHFETRAFNTTIFDAENCSQISFNSTQFTHNNNPNGANASVTLDDIVPMFKFKNVFSVLFENPTITIQSSSQNTNLKNRLFDLGGRVHEINFIGGFIGPALHAAGLSVNQLWQSNEEVPYVSNGEPVMRFLGTLINDNRFPGGYQDRDTLSSPVARNRRWGRKIDASSNDLTYYFTDKTEINFDTSPLYRMSTDGMFRARSFSSETIKLIANQTSENFGFPFNNNANKRGIYLIYANSTKAAFAILFSTGSILFPAFTGADAIVSTKETEESGKLNIYLKDTSLQVKNMLGANVNVVVIPFGF